MIESLLFRFRSFKLSEDIDNFNPVNKVGDKIYIDSLMYFPKLTNNTNIINRYFSSEKFISHIGSHRYNNLTNDSSFGYQFINAQGQTPENRNHEDYLLTTTSNTITLNELFTFLWFIKDCAAHLYESIIYCEEGDYCDILPNHEQYCNSNGKYDTAEFSKDEIKQAISYLFHFRAAIQKGGASVIAHGSLDYDTLKHRSNLRKYSTMSRIERAMGFLSYARRETFIPMKIAMFSPVLESLFCSEKSGMELIDIAYSIGAYVANDKEEVKVNAEIIKDTYKLRSRYIHGDKIFKHDTYDEQIILSKEIDALTRKVLTKALIQDWEHFIQPNKQLKKWIRSF
jgi:hypothetical protein